MKSRILYEHDTLHNQRGIFTKYFLILMVLVGLAGTSYAIPEFTEAEKVHGADSIGIGQILSYRDEGDYRFYEISILKVLKNTLPDKIMMRSVNEQGFDPIDPYDILEKEDVVLLYLKDYSRGFWESTNFSQKIPNGRLQNTINEITKLVEQTEKTIPEPPSEFSLLKHESPLKQFKSGISASDIVCKDGLILQIKNWKGIPVCVKPETKQKLIERGWATSESESSYNPYETRCSSGVVPFIPENWRSIGLHPTDDTWENLGRHIIKQEFYEQLKQKDIIFQPACFGVYTGFADASYPPKFSMCAVVTELDGSKIYLEGSAHEFDVTFLDMNKEIPYLCDENHYGCLCGIENEN